VGGCPDCWFDVDGRFWFIPVMSISHKVYRTQGDGRWFPARGAALRAMVSGYIDQAGQADGVPAVGRSMCAAVAPHAGYIYSGAVAGHTYRFLQAASQGGCGPDLVVVLGFPHRVSFRGVAWLDADVIRTPMGDMRVDREGMRRMLQAGGADMFLDQSYHAQEHSAENQLPFIQVALPGVPLVVALIGGHDHDAAVRLASALHAAGQGRRICVIASTDLLHDPDYDRVVASDQSTLAMMENLDSDGLNKAWSYTSQVCCGISPVLAALEVARRGGCRRGKRLAYCNSGDIDPAGRGQWVVGYGAMVFEGNNEKE